MNSLEATQGKKEGRREGGKEASAEMLAPDIAAKVEGKSDQLPLDPLPDDQQMSGPAR